MADLRICITRSTGIWTGLGIRQRPRTITRSFRRFRIPWISSRPFRDVSSTDTQRADIYAAHEGLHLHYEQAQTRYLDRRERWYNLTTHFPWIGMRTAQLDGAHIEYFRGIANPVGVKIGPGMTREWLQGLVESLEPKQRTRSSDTDSSIWRQIGGGTAAGNDSNR